MSSIACRVLVFVSLFLFGATSLTVATPKAIRPIYLESGLATFEGSLEAGGIRLEAVAERGRFQATLRPTFNGMAVEAGLVGAANFSLWISATPDGVRSAAVFGDLGSIDRLHGVDGLVVIGETVDDCERLLGEPSLAALQRVNAELAAAGESLEEQDLWLAFLLRQLELSVGTVTSCGDAIVQPASGQCSIQLTYVGCRMCCDIDERLGGFLVPICGVATRGSGGLVGGWAGSLVGGLVGDFLCEAMMQDVNCWDRCIGKDGDPSPIWCFDPGEPEEVGVCRQICEAGQHNIGSAGCPATGSIVLTCCISEYDPPDDDECPDSICPGPVCPPECDDILQ